MTDKEKELEYFKTAANQSRTGKRPPFVPSMVRLNRVVRGDFPFSALRLDPGEYKCECNQYGAVSVKTESGELLGLMLDEFEIIEWQRNDAVPQ